MAEASGTRFRRVRGCSSVGRASVFQTECREFESRRPLQAIELQDVNLKL